MHRGSYPPVLYQNNSLNTWKDHGLMMSPPPPPGGAEERPHGSGVAHHQRGEVRGHRLLGALHRDGNQRHGISEQRNRFPLCLPW